MDTDRSRLLWRCRRGIREMDLLLQNFMTQHFDDLTDDQKRAFDDILDEADLDIMTWIMNKGQPSQKDYRSIITLLQQTNSQPEC